MEKIEAEAAPRAKWFDKAGSLKADRAIRRTRDPLRSELIPVRRAFADYRRTRDRDGVYLYLDAVFGLVEKWTRLGCARKRARRALRLQNTKHSGGLDPFSAVIMCTAQTAKGDRRTVSKWSRALRYAAQFKKEAISLRDFVKCGGGINACAASWSRRALSTNQGRG
jgi:hypothetical protein